MTTLASGLSPVMVIDPTRVGRRSFAAWITIREASVTSIVRSSR